jgi:23S rRNA pseudouridine1911/1915/1917 synthase
MSKVIGSRQRNYVVSGRTVALAAIIEELAPGDEGALREGRVFVNGRRVDASARNIAPGSRVTWYAPRAATRSSTDADFRILDRRDNVVVVAKPAHWSSESDQSGHRTSLREQVSRLLNVRGVHVATRLDIGVSGLAIVAIGQSACRQCAALQKAHQIKKDYLAIAIGTVAESALWNTPIDRGREALTLSHRLSVSNPVRFAGAVIAPASLLQINAATGRYHQIRIHASSAGHPLLGDRRYAGTSQWVRNDGSVQAIVRPMLHAWRVRISWEGTEWTAVCPVPDDMRDLWADLGGSHVWPES